MVSGENKYGVNLFGKRTGRDEFLNNKCCRDMAKMETKHAVLHICNHVKEDGEREVFVFLLLDWRGRQRNIQMRQDGDMFCLHCQHVGLAESDK